MINLEKYDIIDIFTDIFNSLGINAYMVGGAVRDMILGVKPLDFDFAGELGEEEHFKISEIIASQLECSFKYNRFYHTSKYSFKSYDIDFVMARDESYDSIAAKPKVWASNIISDLKRRDFGLNAIALSLKKKEYWKIIDPFNGREDIDKKIIRVFHKDSFMDDPTRLFRGIKYAARFGFSFDRNTENWMKASIESDVFRYLKPDRIKQELYGVFKEKNVDDIIEYIRYFNFIDSITGSSILINSNFNKAVFNRLSSNQKFSVIFYKNDFESLCKLKQALNLPEDFIETCRKLIEINMMLSKKDEMVYNYLLEQRHLNENLLQTLFTGDERIRNFLYRKR